MRINGVNIEEYSIYTQYIYLDWHVNGQRDWLVEYKNHKKHGKRIWWSYDGLKIRDEVWENGELIKDNLA